ncbi:hypothetical protein ACJJIQ_05045 [Microbulbifer sp. ANSA003]|uniref:hypothetical protein n=1 Tax=Microbulbifer sp. ANSA003 TaxID=3243360 RepID=UPI004042CC1F
MKNDSNERIAADILIACLQRNGESTSKSFEGDVETSAKAFQVIFESVYNASSRAKSKRQAEANQSSQS